MRTSILKQYYAVQQNRSHGSDSGKNKHRFAQKAENMQLIDVAIPLVTNFVWNHTGKITKYRDLADQIKVVWGQSLKQEIPVLLAQKNWAKKNFYAQRNERDPISLKESQVDQSIFEHYPTNAASNSSQYVLFDPQVYYRLGLIEILGCAIAMPQLLQCFDSSFTVL